jgi:predicted regulator of amino acid metabolism with ACT domain
MAGTILVPSGEMRIISVDDITVDIPPADHLTLVANTDQPGMIGIVAAALGDAGINIDDMHIGHAPGADMALMVIATRQAISPELAASIEAQDGITSVRSLDLTSN